MGALEKAVPIATLVFVVSSMVAMGLGLRRERRLFELADDSAVAPFTSVGPLSVGKGG
jgi:hypothetical protein